MNLGDVFATQNLISSFDRSVSTEIFDRSILVAGLGGNGTHLALAAVRLGFAHVAGVDLDVVSPSNLTRQVLYTGPDIGVPKAVAAEKALNEHNLRSAIAMHQFDIVAERQRFIGLVDAADLVFIVLDQPAPTYSP